MKKEKCKTFFSLLLLFLLLPVLITVFMQPQGTWLRGRTDADSQQEEELCALVAHQISLNSQPEAIKAQAVIARTMMLSGKADTDDGAVLEELKSALGEEAYARQMKLLETYVQETAGIALTIDGGYIDAAYHAVSAGMTRNASEVYEKESLSYLAAVSSQGDLLSPDYLQVLWFTKEEFAEKLAELSPDGTAQDTENVLAGLEIMAYDSSGYVTALQIGSETVGGEAFREAFSLPSACFSISECEGEIRIVTKGLGHGFGLSQYGANTLAAEGMGWREILKYYYPQVNISAKNCPY